MSFEAADRLARCGIPQAGGLVLQGHQHPAAVRRKGERIHHVGMLLEAAQVLAAGSFPQLGALIGRARQHPSATGGNRGGMHAVSFAAEQTNLPSREGIP